MKILSFSPYLGIWQHALPESFFLEALSAKHEIIHLQCNGLFKEHCVTMCSYGVKINDSIGKNKVCIECKKNRSVINNSFNFKNAYIENFVDEQILMIIEAKMKQVTKDNYMHFMIDEIPIGKYAYYMVSLQYKKNSYEMSSFEFSEYLINLKNCLISYYVALRVVQEIQPDAVVIYNTHYPTNRVFSDVLIKNGIIPYFIHAGPNISHRLNSLSIGKNHYYEIQKNQIVYWEKIKNKKTAFDAFELIRAHYEELIIASNPFVYSSSAISGNKDLKKHYNIPPGKKVLLLTMSSFDERFAAESIGVLDKHEDLIFDNQVQWVQEVVDFVGNNKEFFLIIRTHPREFPNKRESVLSENGIQLRNILNDLPSNVVVNWPEENISIYSLSKITDLCLNFASSVGKELTFFGIPVLIYLGKGLSYPTDINYLALSRNEYFNQLKFLATADFDLNKLKNLFRWYSIEFFYSVLYFDPMVTLSEKKQSYWIRLKRKLLATISDRYIHSKDAKKKLNTKNKDHILKYIENDYETLIELHDFSVEDSSGLDEIYQIKKVVQSISNKIYFKNELFKNRTTQLLEKLEMQNS